MKDKYRYDKMKFVRVRTFVDKLPGLILAVGMLIFLFGPLFTD